MRQTHAVNNAAAIWNRLIGRGRDGMSAAAARYFLELAFDPRDLGRMHELAVKNQGGDLTPDELEELKAYRQIGLELDLLRAKARRVIKSANGR